MISVRAASVSAACLLIAERRVDAGKLMACTFRLREHLGEHPVATILLDDMIGHMARRLQPA